MDISEYKKLSTGLYKINWKSGGYSSASIGMLENGDKWIAPTNWSYASKDQSICEDIDTVFRLYAHNNKVSNNNKPPLGLTPKYIHDRNRSQEIITAMQRYIDNEKSIPKEWIEELSVLCCDN